MLCFAEAPARCSSQLKRKTAEPPCPPRYAPGLLPRPLQCAKPLHHPCDVIWGCLCGGLGRYNDASVLENHHVASLFELLASRPGADVLGSLDDFTFLAVRKLIIGGILSTDMTRHFPMVSQVCPCPAAQAACVAAALSGSYCLRARRTAAPMLRSETKVTGRWCLASPTHGQPSVTNHPHRRCPRTACLITY